MNTITITGRIEGQPVRKETDKSVVTTIRLASGRAKNRGGRLWIDVDTWGRLAGITNRAGRPGRSIVATGRLEHRTWAGVDGETGHRWYVVATDIEFLDDLPSEPDSTTTS
ncbi:MAG: single-stranded DNA-binding protein [Acidimicrobiales bacterium]|nr:single-stranded DNA-binding protein [Acidimicrobiales bacterium]